VDENLWGRSIEAGVLEDPWSAPPRDVYQWTVDPSEAPARPHDLTVTFRAGVPVSIGGDGSSDGVTLIEKLNAIGGKHGIGRIDQIEDRLVGIKSREIYEAPAAVILHTAHRALEDLVLSKESLRMKERIADEYAELVYNGLWFSAHHQDLAAYVHSTQRFVTGEVRVRLDRGNATVSGRRSDNALYSMSLATYGKGDAFDHKAAEGFIQVYGLPLRNQAQRQALWSGDAALPLKLPDKKEGGERLTGDGASRLSYARERSRAGAAKEQKSRAKKPTTRARASDRAGERPSPGRTRRREP
jgi:argininosuccinate synthase